MRLLWVVFVEIEGNSLPEATLLLITPDKGILNKYMTNPYNILELLS